MLPASGYCTISLTVSSTLPTPSSFLKLSSYHPGFLPGLWLIHTYLTSPLGILQLPCLKQLSAWPHTSPSPHALLSLWRLASAGQGRKADVWESHVTSPSAPTPASILSVTKSVNSGIFLLFGRQFKWVTFLKNLPLHNQWRALHPFILSPHTSFFAS